jgi:6-pyruvoyltetrahydropterin/6-carboxytetrahydropterin synthase
VTYEIFHETMVSAAHRLLLTTGDAERMHGHNWRIRAHLRASRLDERGMVLDFYDLERVLRGIVQPFEHVVLNDVPPFDDINPTAENFARVVFDALDAAVADDRVAVARVEVWETDACCATYSR